MPINFGVVQWDVDESSIGRRIAVKAADFRAI